MARIGCSCPAVLAIGILVMTGEASSRFFCCCVVFAHCTQQTLFGTYTFGQAEQCGTTSGCLAGHAAALTHVDDSAHHINT